MLPFNFTNFTPNKIKNLFTNHFRFISDDKHLHIFPFLLENTELQIVRSFMCMDCSCSGTDPEVGEVGRSLLANNTEIIF